MGPFELYFLGYIHICNVLVYIPQEVDSETRVQVQVIYLRDARNFTWGVRTWAKKGSQPMEGMFQSQLPLGTQDNGVKSAVPEYPQINQRTKEL